MIFREKEIRETFFAVSCFISNLFVSLYYVHLCKYIKYGIFKSIILVSHKTIFKEHDILLKLKTKGAFHLFIDITQGKILFRIRRVVQKPNFQESFLSNQNKILYPLKNNYMLNWYSVIFYTYIITLIKIINNIFVVYLLIFVQCLKDYLLFKEKSAILAVDFNWENIKAIFYKIHILISFIIFTNCLKKSFQCIL